MTYNATDTLMHETATRTAPTLLFSGFLTSFLLFDVLLGKFAGESGRKAAYLKYAEIFRIKDTALLESTYHRLSNKIIYNADEVNSFNVLYRVTSLYPASFTDEEKYIIYQKSNAIRCKTELFGVSESSTLESVQTRIEAAAGNGNVDCIALLAFTEANGYTVAPDREKAMRRINKLVAWNSLFGVLMGLYFNPDCSNRYGSVLNAVLSGSFQLESYAYLASEYNFPTNVRPDFLATALETAFNRGGLLRIKMNHTALRTIFSTVLSDTSKRKILLQIKEGSYSELPINITQATELRPQTEKLRQMVLLRENELDAVLANLSIIDVRSRPEYKPLLLISDDPYVLKLYEEAIANCFGEDRVGITDFGDSTNNDFSKSDNNAIMTALEPLHDRNSVLIMKNCDKIENDKADDLAVFLKGEYRAKYKAANFGVVYDFSGILPILTASSFPSDAITQCCDVITLQAVEPSEMGEVFGDIIDDKASLFGLSSIKAEKGTLSSAVVGQFTPSSLSAVLDKVIGENRDISADILITIEMLSEYADEYGRNRKTFSFWGGNNR